MFIKLTGPDRLVNADHVTVVSLGGKDVFLQVDGRQETLACNTPEAASAEFERLKQMLTASAAAVQMLEARLESTEMTLCQVLAGLTKLSPQDAATVMRYGQAALGKQKPARA